MGGCPPLGEASVSSTPASRKTKYGAANSSSQKPVLRPVSPNRSCDVSTISIFMFSFSSVSFNAHVAFQRQHKEKRSNEGGRVLLSKYRRELPSRPAAMPRIFEIARADGAAADLPHEQLDGTAAIDQRRASSRCRVEGRDGPHRDLEAAGAGQDFGSPPESGRRRTRGPRRARGRASG